MGFDFESNLARRSRVRNSSECEFNMSVICNSSKWTDNRPRDMVSINEWLMEEVRVSNGEVA
ncbi:hypothetical protein HDF16_006084 [Granulicella aggregans]|uniref:Uncharacterized protein n=1 Tax=Granulicella aggregans TaxID=474949 RepID=A0A7W7ZKD1_9BACT|nr:hypothetical protein [Granulicella aggregans]